MDLHTILVSKKIPKKKREKYVKEIGKLTTSRETKNFIRYR